MAYEKALDCANCNILLLEGMGPCFDHQHLQEQYCRYPHCDPLVLHAPGKCKYCDLYPQRQNGRTTGKVLFTGEEPREGWKACPAERRRDVAKIERWPGNRPARYTVSVYEIGADEEVLCAICKQTNNYTQYGLGQAFLAGPDHPPYNGEANYICKEHLADNALIETVE